MRTAEFDCTPRANPNSQFYPQRPPKAPRPLVPSQQELVLRFCPFELGPSLQPQPCLEILLVALADAACFLLAISDSEAYEPELGPAVMFNVRTNMTNHF